jgi:hypothetical protein
MPANVYSAIEEKGFDDGTVYIMTQNASVIEAHTYSGIIIFFKSLRLSFDQICEVLSRGDIKEITFQKTEVRPEIARAEVLVKTFPGAMAASAINPARATRAKLIRIVRLMSGLIKANKDEETKAFESIRRQIAILYPGFLPDVSTIQKRIDGLGEEFGITTPFLDGKPLPDEIYSVPEFIFRNFEPIGNSSVMKELVLYYLFFGEAARKVVRTTVEQETSLGAKEGHAKLSQMIYAEWKNSSLVSIFKGFDKIGNIIIDWDKHENKTIAMTKADIDHLGLRKGDKINLIFED